MPSSNRGKPKVPNRKALTAYHAATPPLVREADVARAQRTLYQVDEAANREQREALALAALAICPLCADAFCLLAAEAEDRARSRDLYARGVIAGELALQVDSIARYRGRSWLYLDARPYMRARFGLAMRLAELGDTAAAIAHLRALLELNPGDNQGARYPLLAALWRQGDDVGVAQLLESIGDEGSAAWAYSRALTAFRRRGAAGAETEPLGRLALAANPHVPKLLALDLPLSEPNLEAAMGGPEEAADFVLRYGGAWRVTEGAVAWILGLAADEARTDSHKTNGRRR